MSAAAPPLLFTHLLVIRAQEALAPSPAAPLITYQYRASGAGDFPPATPSFAFPDAVLLQKYDTEGYTSEAFIFVLTADTGERLYGYTRRFLPVGSSPRYPEAISLLSHIFAPGLFLELLEHAHIRWLLQPGALFTLLDHCSRSAVPPPGALFVLEWSNADSGTGSAHHAKKQSERLILQRGDPSFSPRTALVPLASALSSENLALLFSALLCEQRILMVSRRLERLSECIHAAVALLQPLEWQHILIPLLPHDLLSYCTAPMPYLLGLHEMYLDELLAMPGMDSDEHVLIVDLDQNRISRASDRYTQLVAIQHDEDLPPPHQNDLFTFPLPEELGTKLRKQLKSVWADELTDQALYETFGTFWLSLLGFAHWSEIGLDLKGKFQMDAFLARAHSLTAHNAYFLRLIAHSQCLERFCEEQTVAGKGGPLKSMGVLTPASRFERVKQEVLIAAAADDAQKPLHALRSFSFVLKRLHHHCESALHVSAAASAAHHPDAHFPGEAEVRKMALEVTSNSALAAKRGTVREVSDQLATLTFDTRACAAILAVVFERLANCRKGDHLHGSKGLLLLEHLLHHGSDRVVLHAMLHPQAQKLLQHLAYTYTHEHERTCDAIRTIGLRIHALLNNIFLLRKTRHYCQVMDLRRFRYFGGAPATKAAALTVNPEAATGAIHHTDPEYDEFRHRSLVEMSLPALPHFDALHTAYKEEFEKPAALPTPAHVRRGSQSSTPTSGRSVHFRTESGISAPAPVSPTHHGQAAAAAQKDLTFDFDFAAFDGSAGFGGMTTTPPQTAAQYKAILPPSNATQPPPAASSSPYKAILPPPQQSLRPPTGATSATATLTSSITSPSRPPPSTTAHASTGVIDTSFFAGSTATGALTAASPSRRSPPTRTSTSTSRQLAPPPVVSKPIAAPVQKAPTAAPPAAAVVASSHSPWQAFDDAFAADPAPFGQSPVKQFQAILPPQQQPAPSQQPTPPQHRARLPSVDPSAVLDFFSATAAPAPAPKEKKVKKAKN